ncbi:hypothetical protein C2E23DRAFT_903721 [Lenzites betulinus]|nr:hypothetical protein C2E23DRAFT_903721 [Lenzites betulinus]
MCRNTNSNHSTHAEPYSTHRTTTSNHVLGVSQAQPQSTRMAGEDGTKPRVSSSHRLARDGLDVGTLKFSTLFPISVTQCESIPIDWTGGVPPYNLTAIGEVLFTSPSIHFTYLQDTSYQWNVSVPSGHSFYLRVADSVGGVNGTDASPIINVLDGADFCLSAQASISALPSSSPSAAFIGTPSTLALPHYSVPTAAIPSSSVSSSASGGPPLSAGERVGIAAGTCSTVVSVLIVVNLICRRRSSRKQSLFEVKEPFTSQRSRPIPTPTTGIEAHSDAAATIGSRPASSFVLPTPDASPRRSAPPKQQSPPRRNARQRGRSAKLNNAAGGAPNGARDVGVLATVRSALTLGRAAAGAPPLEGLVDARIENASLVAVCNTHEEDGGVRLAGGPPDEASSNAREELVDTASATRTLPPPYRRY